MPMRHPILIDWNRTAREYPSDASIAELFRRQVKCRPEQVALSCGSERFTYAEVDAITDRFGWRLLARGIGRGTVVGVLSERSVEPILAMLAILKTGAAYLPLHPQTPPHTLTKVLTLTKANLLLVQADLENRLERQLACPVLPVESVRQPDCLPSSVHWPPIVATDPAYLMFTSGSMGQPKGVVIGQRSVVNLAVNAGYAEPQEGTIQLQLAPLSFDASTFEIWRPLLTGGRLVVYPERFLSIAVLEQVLRGEAVTTLWLTAGLFAAIVRNSPQIFRTLRCLLTGGDTVPASAAVRFLEANPGCALVNGYGPTECTTFSCCHIVTPADGRGGTLPIGRPIANVRAYVVDSQFDPLPPETPGQLCIAGDGLAIGYINAPGQGESPFVTVDFGEGLIERIYCTGDRAQFSSDGVIEFLGRWDRQVKIRGYRVELDAVEVTLRQHPEIEEACVQAEGESGERRMVAYFIAGLNRTPLPETIRSFLRARLPEYLIPSELIQLDRFPLTTNGKIDRRALARPSSADSAACPDRGTSLENQLADIWQAILNLPRIGLHEDFFEMGGDSLRALCLCAEIEARLGVVLPMTALQEASTVHKIAQLITNSGVEWKRLVRVSRADASPQFFCVHGLSGDPFNLFMLAHHLHCGSFYAFQRTPPLSVSSTSVPAMAREYVESLREIQRAGPYRLGGYSAGGVVAFEMARQLTECGEEVATLVMLDAEAPALIRESNGVVSPPNPAQPALPLHAGFQGAAGEFSNVSPYAQRRLAFMVDFLAAVLAYQPAGVYRHEIEVISSNPSNAQLGWDQLSESVRAAVIPGEHLSLLKEPHVQQVAAHLRTILVRS